jgi:hypothetical protein
VTNSCRASVVAAAILIHLQRAKRRGLDQTNHVLSFFGKKNTRNVRTKSQTLEKKKEIFFFVQNVNSIYSDDMRLPQKDGINKSLSLSLSLCPTSLWPLYLVRANVKRQQPKVQRTHYYLGWPKCKPLA